MRVTGIEAPHRLLPECPKTPLATISAGYSIAQPTAANPYDIDIFDPVYGQPKPVALLNQDLSSS